MQQGTPSAIAVEQARAVSAAIGRTHSAEQADANDARRRNQATLAAVGKIVTLSEAYGDGFDGDDWSDDWNASTVLQKL
jgi:hypothetical protein